MEKRQITPLEYASPTKGDGNRKLILFWMLFVILIGMSALIAFITRYAGVNRETSREALCGLNLKTIGNGLLLYANAYKGKFPDKLSAVIEEDVLPTQFVCPHSNDTPASVGATTQATIANVDSGGHLSYVYLGKGLSNNLSADFILVYEPLAHHSNAGMNVLFGDMHVEFLTTREATWMLSEINSGHNPPRPDPSAQPARRSSGGGYSSTP